MPSAVVTGASSGIGKSLVKELVSRGYTVFAGARRVENMHELKAIGAHVLSLDVTDQQSIDAFKEYVQQNVEGNKLDYLFNNAGQPCSVPGADLDVEDAVRCYNVNVFGVMRMTRTFIPLLMAAKGTIVNTGSVVAEMYMPFGSVYASSKAALHQYANTLRLELAPFGVKVVTTKTAAVKTEISDNKKLKEDSIYKIVEDGFEYRRELARNNNPQDPDDYAKDLMNILSGNPAPFFYLGNGWFKIFLLVKILPRRLMDYILMRLCKLNEIPKRLAQLKKKND
uniref:ARAD1C26708p n=1 Tax=Blastobotrys adeninivorans TaxID=409370 RepID=A0A060T1R0_BLAAD